MDDLSLTKPLELTLTRVFDAPRPLVFMAWSDPEHLSQWWGPRDYPASVVDMDVRTGGTWRNCLKSPDGGPDLWQRGEFLDVTPPERLVFSFVWEEDGESGPVSTVTVTFVEDGDRTVMHFHQTQFATEASRDGHGYGWNSSFDRLTDYLKG